MRCRNALWTSDVERRFAEHTRNDKKGAKYLRGKAPLALVMKKAKVKKLSKIKKEMFVDGKIKVREIWK
ncbi:MAG: GIY-YIG nuclease family protein [Candidatus Brocadia sp. AMX2]|nr:MAG: GIY-YIG nuclease family protein [Candidatus Brocadia sp. AMX2]